MARQGNGGGWQPGPGGQPQWQAPGQAPAPPRHLPPWPPQDQGPYQPQPYQQPYQPPQYAPQQPRPRKSRKGLAFLGCGGLAAIFILVVALASHGSSSSSSVPPSAASSGPVAPGTPANLAPLTLGHFPATTDGKLAKAVCQQWAGLRQQYADKITASSAYQMNQWFSSPAWAKVQADSAALGGDPAYGNLETALGVGLVGDDASPASEAAIDKACRAAD